MSQLKEPKPKVFISYAHIAAKNVARLAFALSLLEIDVFWDRKLKLGSWKPQLQEKIKECDHFIVMMCEPYLTRANCRNEFRLACDEKKEICPIRNYDFIDLEVTKNGEMKYFDFSKDFDAGFQDLTDQILHRRVSSWESFAKVQEDDLLTAMKEGMIPGFIVKVVGDLFIVDQLWAFIETYLTKTYSNRVFRGKPQTPEGVVSCFAQVKTQLAERNDMVGVLLVEGGNEIVDYYLANIPVSNLEHVKIGVAVYETITRIEKLIIEKAVGDVDAIRAIELQTFNTFNTTETIRKIITDQARNIQNAL